MHGLHFKKDTLRHGIISIVRICVYVGNHIPERHTVIIPENEVDLCM